MSRMSQLIAVCAVHALLPDAGTIGITAIDKRPVEGAVKIGHYGVYALGRDVPPGLFGENLRTEGVDVNAARIGEVWRIGDRLRVEVTMPRTPCQTFARRIGGAEARGWVRRFSDARRLGPYLKVLRSGRVAAGDEIVIEYRPEGAPTILDVYRAP